MTRTRRDVLLAGVSTGVLTLAGCLGGDGGGDGSDGGDGGEEGDVDGGGDTPTPEPTAESTAESGATTGDGGNGDGDSVTVVMQNSAFDPERTTVDPGTTVTWINDDSFGHDVTSAELTDEATPWEFAASTDSGEQVAHTFEEAGAYEYYCSIHGEGVMCGVVLVGDVDHGATLPCEG